MYEWSRGWSEIACKVINKICFKNRKKKSSSKCFTINEVEGWQAKGEWCRIVYLLCVSINTLNTQLSIHAWISFVFIFRFVSLSFSLSLLRPPSSSHIGKQELWCNENIVTTFNLSQMLDVFIRDMHGMAAEGKFIKLSHFMGKRSFVCKSCAWYISELTSNIFHKIPIIYSRWDWIYCLKHCGTRGWNEEIYFKHDSKGISIYGIKKITFII